MEKARQGDGMYVRADFLQKRTHRALPHAPTTGKVEYAGFHPAPRLEDFFGKKSPRPEKTGKG